MSQGRVANKYVVVRFQIFNNHHITHVLLK